MNKKLLIFALLGIFFFQVSNVLGIGSFPSVSNDMVLYYHFNNQSAYGENDTYVYDFSGSGNNGTVNAGALWNSSGGFLVDGSFNFSGAQWIQVSNSNSLNFNTFTNYSIILWIKRNGNPSATEYLVDKQGGGGANEWDLSIDSSGRISMRSGQGSSTGTTTRLITDNNFHLITIVAQRNVTSGLLIYIDGILNLTANLNATANISNTFPLYIGKRSSGNNFRGEIDEIIIYNRTLGEREVWELYNLYGGCINLSITSVIKGNTTLCSQSYSINSTNGNRAVYINDSNVNFNGNNVILYGNLSNNSRGVYIQNFNVTIANITIFGYDQNLRSDAANFLVLDNVTILDSGTYGVEIFASNNTIVKSSVFKNMSSAFGLHFSSSDNSTVFNNFFIENVTFSQQFIRYTLSKVGKVYSNNFTNGVYHVRVENSFSDLSVWNNTFYNGKHGLLIDSGGVNINFSLNRGYNQTQSLFWASNSSGVFIMNNFINYSGLAHLNYNGSNYTISNNLVYNHPINLEFNFGAISLTNHNNVSIINNTIKHTVNRTFEFSGDNDFILVSSNTFFNSTGDASEVGPFIDIGPGNSKNFTIYNNNFNSSSMGIRITNNTNIYIINNVLDDFPKNHDSYSNGIMAVLNTNISIINNSISRVGCSAILINGGSNVNISYNSLYGNITYNLDNGINCAYEPITGITISQLWKNWLQISLDNNESNYPAGSDLSLYNTNNVWIFNNSITGFPVLLKSQAVYNLSNDLSNYWFRSFQIPTFLVNRTDFYISNSWDNVTTTQNSTDAQPTYVYLSTTLAQSRRTSIKNDLMQFEIFKAYLYFKNVNLTQNLTTRIYNLTNALIYTSNGSTPCTNIDSCDGNINITLYPNNYSYVLEEFNLTENVNREFSPLWFSSSSSTTKKISSNLTDTINATVQMDISPKYCNQLSSINYISNTGTYRNTFIQGNYNCTGSTVSLELNGIEPAADSNILTLNYEGDGICDSWEDSFSIDCNVASSPGGGGGGSGNYTNQTLYLNETQPNVIIKIPSFIEWLKSNYVLLLVISLFGVVGYLIYRNFDSNI